MRDLFAQPKTIDNFREAHDFLSNFFPAKVVYDGVMYRSVEAAYQAAKTVDKAERKKIQNVLFAGQAKKLGQTVTLRHGWEGMKLEVMYDLLKQKFAVEPLKKMLLDTEDAVLLEGNTWGDRFFGVEKEGGKWVGQNHLGKLLMRVRQELYAEGSNK